MLVHGLGGSWQNWLEQIPPPPGAARVIALDLPGFGASEMPREEISIEGYGRLRRALCDALDLGQVVVVGNSMGGFIAAEFAIQYPERVERLVLQAPPGSQYQREREPLMAGARVAPGSWRAGGGDRPRRSRAAAPRCAGAAVASSRHPSRLPADLIYELISRVGPRGFVPALDAIVSYDFRDRLSRIECPTLVVWGATTCSCRAATPTSTRASIPDSRKVVFEDTGHSPMMERPAGVQRRCWCEFLAEEGEERPAGARVEAQARGRRGAARGRARRGRRPSAVVRAPSAAEPTWRRTSRARRSCSAARAARRRRRARRSRVVELDVEPPVRHVEDDGVAVADRGDRAAARASGATWPAMKPWVAPEKRPSVSSATSSPRPSPTIAAVTASISRMPGPPLGPSLRMTTTSPFWIDCAFTAANASSSDSNTRAGPRCSTRLVAGDLHDAALGREVAAQDREAAVRLERVVERADDLLALGLLGRRGLLADRPAGDGHRVAVQQAGSSSRLADTGTPPARYRSVATKRPPGLRSASSGVLPRSGRSRRRRADARPRWRRRGGGARRWSSRRSPRRRRSRSRATRA